MKDVSAQEIKDEWHTTRKQLLLVEAVALLLLSGGAVFYHIVEKLHWLDSFYFCTITLATVGYGDITPKTNLGKLFTIFYVLVGIGIITTSASLLIKNARLKREYKIAKRHQAQSGS